MPTLGLLSSDMIAAQARAANEPEWMVTWRAEAWDFFAQAAPPKWRRTQLAELQQETIAPLFKAQGTAIQWDKALESKGVVFSSLAAALHTHEDLIRPHIGTAVNPLAHKFSAMRAALWQDGVLLYVPRNVEVELPLRLSYTLADGSRAMFPYTIVILEQHARLSLVEEYTSRGIPETALVAPTTELFIGPGAEVRYLTLQQQGQGVYQIGGQVMQLGRDALGKWTSIALGGQLQHMELEARMQGDGSRINWVGATFGNQQQNLVTVPWLRHIGTNTESHLEFKTVVTDKSYSVFDGMIKIEHESHSTVTRLEEHAIHLGSEARSDSIPGLMIDTNDVARAGHASTSGQVDEEQLFYMQARGIRPDEAKRLIVMGFFEPALAAVPLEALRESLEAAIEAKI
ncbi:MAG: Fe-S cluster assembly protein SufD [Chloroflexaceae bacterium]|nr:Fe-S cluster assembly protein SufD [Chloroflexaceae bacterium]NJO04948.1 Fe-S cluster assembly protein SufD [Chloroflexaceae bacterium]